MTNPTSLTSCVLLPVVGKKNAQRAARSLQTYRPETVVVLHVVEVREGGVDSAPVQQREQAAEEAFAAAKAELPDANVQTELRYESDIVDAIFDTAVEVNASAIAFTPRSGSRVVRLLTGNIALSLITETDRPVIALPTRETQ